MFAGLDDIDWGAMNHAYGPADEVPDLLRALVSDDPAARESALDGMYGAVHHQGDVYDCTLASIPFLLEAVASLTLSGRGAVLKLLASIGGADRDDVDDSADMGEGDSRAPAMRFYQARRAVAAACPLFLNLLADVDPQVRRAAPAALLVCHADALRVVAALQDRLRSEVDPAARAAIVAAVGTLGRRSAAGRSIGVDAGAVGGWLAEQAAGPADPALRLVALAELARYGSAVLPPRAVSIAVELLQKVYAAGTPPAQPTGFSTDTLIGAIREMSEGEAAGRRSPEAAELVRDLSMALGGRIEDRVQLLTELLRAPDWEARYDAIRPAEVLMGRWRGSYQELVSLIGEQLADPRPRLIAVAAKALDHIDALAAPAADALAHSLEAAPREAPHTSKVGPPAWITIWPRDVPTAGPTLRALTTLLDARALPAIRWALEHPNMPGDIGLLVAQFGPAAAELVPLIRRRLRDLPAVDGHDRRRYGLIAALGRIGEAAAAAVPDLVALAPDAAVLTALAGIGPGAAGAIPAMRRLLDHGGSNHEIHVASALWHVEGDPGRVLPVLVRHLDGDGMHAAAAAETLALLGPAAAATAPRLRELLRDANSSAGLRLHAAEALLRVAGDAGTALPVLSKLWSENPYTRVSIARCVAQMGAAAQTAAPLLREELGRRRRHTVQEHGWSSDQVRTDLALLRACDAALASVSP